MTTDFNLVLPLIGSVTAYLVAESIAGSLYGQILELSGIHLQKKLLCRILAELTAKT